MIFARSDPKKLLDKRTELVSKCWHRVFKQHSWSVYLHNLLRKNLLSIWFIFVQPDDCEYTWNFKFLKCIFSLFVAHIYIYIYIYIYKSNPVNVYNKDKISTFEWLKESVFFCINFNTSINRMTCENTFCVIVGGFS